MKERGDCFMTTVVNPVFYINDFSSVRFKERKIQEVRLTAMPM